MQKKKPIIDKETNSQCRTKPGTAVRTQGKKTVDDIIKIAKNILVTKGYANLTMRSVAKEAGISPGNLTYYFRSKKDLFNLLIEEGILQYDKQIAAISLESSGDPKSKFLAFIKNEINQCDKSSSRQFFYQYWATSIHDPFVAKCRKHDYEVYKVHMSRLMKEMNAKLTPLQANHRALLLCGLIEGMYVTLNNIDKMPRGFKKEFCERALSMVYD